MKTTFLLSMAQTIVLLGFLSLPGVTNNQPPRSLPVKVKHIVHMFRWHRVASWRCRMLLLTVVGMMVVMMVMVLRMSRMLLLMIRRRLLLLRKLVPRYWWTAVASSTVHSQLGWHSPHHTTLMPVTTTTTTGRRTVVRIRQISARVSAFVRSVRIGPKGRWGVERLLIAISLETSTHRHAGRSIVMTPRVVSSVGKTDRLDSTTVRRLMLLRAESSCTTATDLRWPTVVGRSVG